MSAYLRKLQNVNPCEGSGRYLNISIPAALCGIFKTDIALIECLPDGKGIMVRPARVETM
jgi:hypothetical protein